MDDLSPEDIDHIFKKGTDKQEFPFKESAWDNMEQILNEEDSKRTLAYYIISSVAALFVGTALFFGVHHFSNGEDNQKSNNQPNLVIKNKPNEILANDIYIRENANQKDLKIDLNQNKLDSKKIKTTQFDNHEVTADTKLVSKSKVIGNKTITTNAFSNQKNNISVEEPNKNLLLNRVQNTVQEKTTIPEKYSMRKNSFVDIESIATVDSDELHTTSNTNTLPIAALNKVEYVSEPIHTEAIVLSKPATNRFTYSGLLAYGASSVLGVSNSKSGFKFGTELAYQFGGKFQISSGLAISLKRYETAGVNYSPVQARLQWVDDVPPEIVDGTCTVFEVPVEFTYYLKDYRQSGFFAGAGLNSYFLTKEGYDFKFDSEHQSVNQLSWTTKNNDDAVMQKHFFGVATVQLGYQRQVSNKLAFQVAPYIQLPLTGIGFGDVNLFTTGIQVKFSLTK